MITDIHCHFVPPAFLDFLTQRDTYGVRLTQRGEHTFDLDIRGTPITLGSAFFDLSKHGERMARCGIDHSVLSLATPFVDYRQNETLGLAAARAFNDSLAAEICSDRERFGGWALLPMQDPDAAATELVRCVRELGFVGGHVASNVRGIYLYDDAFEPVFRAAVDLDAPLLIHPHDPLGKERMQSFEMVTVAGYLFDSTINMLGMACSGFLDRWPTLKLVCAHAGAFAPALGARLQREADTNPLIAAGLKGPVSAYVARFFVDSICFEPELLRFAARAVPPEQILLGSDYPFALSETDPAAFVRSSLPPREADLVIHENFSRLIGKCH